MEKKKKIKCRFCQSYNLVFRPYCKQCGEFLRKDDFLSEDIYINQQNLMKRVMKNIKEISVPNTEDSSIQSYIYKCDMLEKILRISYLEFNKEDYLDEVYKLKMECKNPEFQIAFV